MITQANCYNKNKTIIKTYKIFDLFYFQLTCALIISGLIFAVSSSTYESLRLTNSFWSLGLKQIIALAIGLIAFFVLWKLNYKSLFKYAFPFSLLMLAIMSITIFTSIGKASGGSQRWIDIGGFQFQPAEVAKFAAILLTSKMLTKYSWKDYKKYSIYLLIVFLITLTIFKQPDLGSASIVLLTTFELLFIFGWPLWLLFSFIPFLLFAVYKKLQSTPYQMERITYWLNPYLDPEGKGYNLIQASYALGLGNLFGVGLGNSMQKQGFLPVSHSDFIFAIMGEEIGLFGLTAILLLYFTWILRGIYLTNKIQNKFGRILGTGIILMIATQAIINISVAVGLFPVTGVTLPFFSCGGTSLIVTLAMTGIVFNILSSKKNDFVETA